MKHRWLKYYKVYINHDPEMTVTQSMARSTWVVDAFEWEKMLKCHLKGKAAGNWQMDRLLIILEKKMAQGLHLPLQVKYHNIQTYSRSQVSVYRTIGPLVLVPHVQAIV